MRVLRWKISPAAVVSVTALTVVGASIVTSLAQRIGVIEPHVLIVGESAEESAVTSESKPLTPPQMDGEVIRTTERLREVSALTMALVLYAARERIEGRTPGTVDALLAGVTRHGLIPPGLTPQGQSGTIVATHRTRVGTASHGTLFVRYRPEPLGIEVFAVSHERRDGPAMMMRVPDDAMESKGASFFMATRLDDVVVPQPFAGESDVLAAGWSRESLRAVKLLPEEQGSLRQWSVKRASSRGKFERPN